MKLSSFLTPLRLLPVLAAALLTIAPNTASAAVTVFNFTFSGASFSNTAVATGKISIDTARLPNPGNTGFDDPLSPIVTDLSLTVSGASSGNGTFGLADYYHWILEGTQTLDLTTQLVGQGGWGISNGDFNLFASNSGFSHAAPRAIGPFKLATGGFDDMILTSFAPDSASVVPEPSRALLLAAGLTGMMLRRRRK
jgi:hypothetical protein